MSYEMIVDNVISLFSLCITLCPILFLVSYFTEYPKKLRKFLEKKFGVRINVGVDYRAWPTWSIDKDSWEAYQGNKFVLWIIIKTNGMVSNMFPAVPLFLAAPLLVVLWFLSV